MRLRTRDAAERLDVSERTIYKWIARKGLPVLTIISPAIKAPLNLLSKLSYGLKGSPFAAAVAGKSSSEEILRTAALLDTGIPASNSQATGTSR